MRTFAVILAAGASERFGDDKSRLNLGGQPLWRWSYEAFRSHPEIEGVGFVGSPSNLEDLAASGADFAILGGDSRQKSSALGCERTPDSFDAVLVHDAARPFVSRALISRVIEGVRRVGAAAPGLPVADTLRRASGETPARNGLFAMQTPQGALRSDLIEGHRLASPGATDEISVISSLGRPFEIVPGDANAFKMTYPSDFQRAAALIGAGEQRVGFGYDIHPFSQDAGRELFLGGVKFEGAPGLEGHSDADVLLHAATDAILGALALGDIGQHFPNTDPKWKGAASILFLEHAAKLAAEQGYDLISLDATLIAERPKVMARAAEMRERMATALAVGIDRISVKATTNEGLGSIGRGEGIAAHAVATLRRRPTWDFR